MMSLTAYNLDVERCCWLPNTQFALGFAKSWLRLLLRTSRHLDDRLAAAKINRLKERLLTADRESNELLIEHDGHVNLCSGKFKNAHTYTQPLCWGQSSRSYWNWSLQFAQTLHTAVVDNIFLDEKIQRCLSLSLSRVCVCVLPQMPCMQCNTHSVSVPQCDYILET